MNYYWEGLAGQMILLDLQQLSQITHSNLPSQITYHTRKEKRFLNLCNNLLIVLLVKGMIPTIMIVRISCPWVTVPTIVPINVKDICMHNHPLLLIICYLWYLEVTWNWRNVFVLMAIGILNDADPILQFNVLHSRKSLGSNTKQVSNFTNL
jgi:hypothetical protein